MVSQWDLERYGWKQDYGVHVTRVEGDQRRLRALTLARAAEERNRDRNRNRNTLPSQNDIFWRDIFLWIWRIFVCGMCSLTLIAIAVLFFVSRGENGFVHLLLFLAGVAIIVTCWPYICRNENQPSAEETALRAGGAAQPTRAPGVNATYWSGKTRLEVEYSPVSGATAQQGLGDVPTTTTYFQRDTDVEFL